MNKLINTYRNAGTITQILASVTSFIFYGFSSSILEASYTASKFPVPYFIGQTSFDAVKIKAWYQYMINAGTFDIYFKTQLIDFLFIASVILGGFFLWTLVANLHSSNSVFRKYGYVAAFALPLAGLFDVFENLISFVMIANSETFSTFTAYIYSSFASIKFGFWMLGLLWLSGSIIALIVTRLSSLFIRKTLASS